MRRKTHRYTHVLITVVWFEPNPPNIKFHKNSICDFESLHLDGCVGMAKLYASLYFSVANIPQRQCTFKRLKTVGVSWFCAFTWPNGFSGWFDICDCTWKLELELIFRLFIHFKLSYLQRTIKQCFMDCLTLIISTFIFHTEILWTGDNYDNQRQLFQKHYNFVFQPSAKERNMKFIFIYISNK